MACVRRTGADMQPLIDRLAELLPEGPFYFEPEQRTNLSEWARSASRSSGGTREEVPHAVEVEIESIDHTRGELVEIEAVILVETESQKRDAGSGLTTG